MPVAVAEDLLTPLDRPLRNGSKYSATVELQMQKRQLEKWKDSRN